MSKAMSTLISAIIPTYNRADLLARALRSVAAQEHRPIEAIVIDDGSTDHTPSIIAAHERSLRNSGIDLRYHRQPNAGVAIARNTGFKLARGSYIGLLDSDDLWRPSFCSTLARLLDKHPGAVLAFSGIAVIDDDDRVWKVRDSGMRGFPHEGVLRQPFEAILRYMPLQTSGVMIRRTALESVGSFQPDLSIGEDWDLWYRIARRFDFAYTLEPLACNRSHPDNLPKYDLTALTCNLRVNLKYLPDVKNPETRQVLLDRIERQFTLLQEELLREGETGNGHSHLLRHELAPQTPRFELGSMIARGPGWMGQGYGWLVRALGDLKRGIS